MSLARTPKTSQGIDELKTTSKQYVPKAIRRPHRNVERSAAPGNSKRTELNVPIIDPRTAEPAHSEADRCSFAWN